MINILDLHPQFITDEKGIKQSVILPIAAFQQLVEDLEDLAVVAERRDEPTISHEDLLKELKEGDYL